MLKDNILFMWIFVLFKVGKRPSSKLTKKRFRSTKLDFAEQTGREDLESGENSDGSRAQTFQAEHFYPICQIEMVAKTLATWQANREARKRHT